MDKKLTGIVAYLTIIGWVIAYLLGDKKGAKFHLNQGLVIALVSIIGGIFNVIPLIGGILSLIVEILVLLGMVIGIIGAAQDKENEFPILGSI